MFIKKALYTLTVISMSSAALASGYQISEYSATGLGRSFAGAGVVGDDFSALAFNPAGMAYNKTSGLQGGASAIVLHADYMDKDALEAGDSTMGRVLPHFFAQYKLNDKLTLGAGVYTPYGLITDYDNDWSGGSHGILSALRAVDLSMGVSYQINPMIAVGAAINGQYTDVRLTSKGIAGSTNNLEGDTADAGYTLGITLTPREDIRLGVAYRSKVSHELEGKINVSGLPGPYAALNGDTDIRAKVTTPELVIISGAYDFDEKLTLSATARWTRWTRFNRLDIVTKEPMTTATGIVPVGGVISSTHENWKNTWFFSVGADYQINDNWTVRFGGAYDETVIKSPEYRTVRVPDGRRFFASFGLSYMTGNWQYDLGYTHVWMRGGDARGGETGKSTPNVHYNNAGAYMGGFAIQYKF